MHTCIPCVTDTSPCHKIFQVGDAEDRSVMCDYVIACDHLCVSVCEPKVNLHATV